MIVRFTEVGAAALLYERVDLLYNSTSPLDSVLPVRDIEQIQNQLADCYSVAEQFQAVEGFLISRIDSTRRSAMPQIEAAAAIIRRSGGRAPILDVARHVAMSQSSLERNFRAVVGVSPKGLSRLVRLQNVCRLWDEGKNLTAIAFDAGYSDQPHLVHDFRQFTGTTPVEFFRSPSPRNLPTFYK